MVVRPGAGGSPAGWLQAADAGALVIVEGESETAAALGFTATTRRVRVQSIADEHAPRTRVVWENALDLPVFRTPRDARVFARERWEGAPLLAGMRYGRGAILWAAADPGARAYDRFPYLPHALADLGAAPPFASRRLWAFFDSSYRLRADTGYLARRWRSGGIAALHVAAWHYWEPDPQRDAYLAALIEACHRNAIAVYAWLELPHVSDAFWDAHPEWREKTAVLQDAHLDWRRLMNLVNRDCFRAVAAGVRDLLGRFDWDGVNLAELYFESLEGAANPARFTPMNDDVRREFRSAHGYDPLEALKDPARLRTLLDWRAALAHRLQAEWLEVLEGERVRKPELDLVLTHIDDRFDAGMRDALGADAAAALPLLERHDFTFLVEDPATVWHLGPQRYPEIARRYQALTPHAARLAIDINVVERYQDVYPTKQQTGTELFQMVRLASLSFARVALYFESSILPADMALLPAAASAVTRAERIGPRLALTARQDVRVRWNGPALVDGRLWPAADDSAVLVPPGTHVVEPAPLAPPLRLLDLNAELRTARPLPGGVEFSYRSPARALAVLDFVPTAVEVDGVSVSPRVVDSTPGRCVVALPRGQHLVQLSRE